MKTEFYCRSYLATLKHLFFGSQMLLHQSTFILTAMKTRWLTIIGLALAGLLALYWFQSRPIFQGPQQATLIGFTTGRGSCFGGIPAPSLKLATNTPLFERMRGDMDLNCGEIVDGTATLEEMGARIYHLLLETASGRKTKSELLGYGEDEFAPWDLGATL